MNVGTLICTGKAGTSSAHKSNVPPLFRSNLAWCQTVLVKQQTVLRKQYGLSLQLKPFLTDRNGNQILKFFPNGTFMETIGSKGARPGQFDGPHGIAIDSGNDNVYVTDMKNHRVQVFDSNDSFIRQ